MTNGPLTLTVDNGRDPRTFVMILDAFPSSHLAGDRGAEARDEVWKAVEQAVVSL